MFSEDPVQEVVEAAKDEEAVVILRCTHMTPDELTEWRASQAVAAAAGPEVEADGLVQLSAEERLESAAWRDEIAADRQLKLQGLAATLSEVSRQRSRERLAEIFATARDRAVERGW